MAANTVTRDYIIWLPNAAQVIQLQQQFPNGITVAPAVAAVTYGAPLNIGATTSIPPAPRIDLYGGLPAASILSVNVASATYAAGFTIDGQGVPYDQRPYYSFSQQAQCLINYPGGKIQWNGYFLSEVANAQPTPANIVAIRAGTGFEVPNSATPAQGYQGDAKIASRSASRTIDGFGYPFRGESGTLPTLKMTTVKESWERFYMCPRVFSAAGTEDNFWWPENSGQAAFAAVNLSLDSTGRLKAYNLGTAAFPGTALGTSTVTLKLNQWVRIDILLGTSSSLIAPNSFSLFVDGVFQFSAQGNAGQGLAVAGNHTLSHLYQTSQQVTYHSAEIDFDDWTNRNYPVNLSGADWNNGDHWTLLKPTGFGANHSTNWVGDWRSMGANPVNSEQSTADNLNELTLTSSALVPMNITTDYVDQKLGPVALALYLAPKTTTVATNKLGYIAQPARFENSAIIGSVAGAAWFTQFTSFAQGAATTAPPLGPIELIYYAEATTAQLIAGVLGEVLMLGAFGTDSAGALAPNPTIQNASYPNSQYANTLSSTPNGPVAVASGTYTGNGTGQTITTTVPLHWMWIRPVSSPATGGLWFSSMVAAHNQLTQKIAPQNGGAFAHQASDGTGLFEISGSQASLNANGVTYQWVGFSDPASRFLLNGAFAKKTSLSTFTLRLADASFAPDGVQLTIDKVNGSANSHYFKGPGDTTSSADLLGTGNTASIITPGTGVMTPLAAVNLATAGSVFAAWRKSDTVASGVVDIITYTGNGSGSNRDIAVALGGRSPMFAIVSAGTGSCFYRDPGHATTHSSGITNGTDSTTAIVGGGINKITVNVALNVNATVYEVLVIAGDSLGNSWTANPSTPIFTADTIARPTPLAPADVNGWWESQNGFFGGATVVTAPQNPKHPRAWDKLAAFVTGSNAGVLGGFPGAAATFQNHLIYAGDDYSVGVQEPPIRIFDGLSDRLMTTMPSIAGVPPQCIVAMVQSAGIIYLTTLDSGTDNTNYAGRVFTFDPNSQVLTPLGTQFTGGEVPYALCWHMDRLWLGTNKGNGTAGKIYFFRPGIDLAWTTDHSLSTDTLGGVTSMVSYRGNLYVGTDNTTGNAGKILVRTTVDGAYATSFTAPNTTTYNGFPSMSVFRDQILAAFWESGGPNALIKRFDGTTWTTAYTGATTTVRPFVAQFPWGNGTYFVGGSKTLGAALLEAEQIGTAPFTFTDLTGFLSGGTTFETALPIVGLVGL